VTSAEAGGRSQRLEAYNSGAWLFCSQPLDVEALILQLRTFIQARREADRLREHSLVDDQTGLYSFRGLAQRAREMGADAFRRQTPLACVVIAPSQSASDDGPTGGRATRLVEYFAELYRKCGRLSDAVGRLGPLEFAVIAPSTSPAGAVRLAERLRSVVESTPLLVEDEPYDVDIRVGYCAVMNFAESPVDAVEMLLRATTALHHARENGDAIKSFDQVPVVTP
jgi:two-component system cell cycle response regulator